MNLPVILRAVLRRWYIAVPGILLSLVVAETVFSAMPPKYTSSGVAVLVRQNNSPTPNSINPVLGSDGGFTTATLTLVQALDTPAVKAELGLREGVDNFTLSNVGKSPTTGWGDHPFLYITTQSSSPLRSTDIVTDVITVARQKLTQLQNDLHVKPQNQIKVESVVDATPPKTVMNMVFAVTGAVLILGIVATCIVTCAWDRIVATRQRRQIPPSTSHTKKIANSRVRAKPSRVG